MDTIVANFDTSIVTSYHSRIRRYQKIVERLLEIEHDDPDLIDKIETLKLDALDAMSYRQLPRIGFQAEARLRGVNTRKSQARALRMALTPAISNIKSRLGENISYRLLAEELNKIAGCPKPMRSEEWTAGSIRAVLSRSV